jgi:hypothetical protein
MTAARQAFAQAAAAIQSAFAARGERATEVTPALLAAAINQLLAVCDRLDEQPAHGGQQEADALAEQALSCIADLALWAERVGCAAHRHAVEALALEVAQWSLRRSGEIRVLEPIVNALAYRANAAHSPDQLIPLCRLMHDIIDHVAPGIRDNSTGADPARPWRVINLNFAIVATRTQAPQLMNAAYDLLEQNLPADCAAFFEEGVRQAGKTIYDDRVRELMRERFAKWTTRH